MTDAVTRAQNRRDIDRCESSPDDTAPIRHASNSDTSKLDAAYDLASRHAPTAVRVGGGLPDIAGVVHADRTFTSMAPLQTEVMRLRGELAKTSDPLVRTAIGMRVNQLSQQWCAMAAAAGWKPPSAAFSPRQATDRELSRALLFVEVGNTFPLGTMQHPIDAQRFQGAILEEWALRTPGVLDRVIAANPKDPRLVPLLEADLARHGDKTPCKPGATVHELLQRRAELARTASWTKAEEDARRKTMGVDGRIAPAEDLASYETCQYILAMNPGTTTGSILAAAAAADGNSIDDMRRGGALGGFVEDIGGLGGRSSAIRGAHSDEKRW